MSETEQLDPSQMSDEEYYSSVIKSVKTVPPELLSIHGAGFWHRTLAKCIDYVIHFIGSIAALMLTFIVLGIYSGVINTDIKHCIDKIESFTLIGFVFSLTGAIMYHAISEGLNGASLGKRICNLVVITEKQALCTFKAALGRSAVFYIDGLFFGAVAAIHMSDTQLRQRLGDKWSHTIVCRRKDLQPTLLESKYGLFKVFVLAFIVDATFQSIGFIIKALG
jgi:uncharacterized RDD family membrane protein YckC